MRAARLPAEVQLLRFASVVRGLAHLALAGSAWVAAAHGGPAAMPSTAPGALALGVTWVILGAHGALQIARGLENPAREPLFDRVRHVAVAAAHLLLSTWALGFVAGMPAHEIPGQAIGLLLLFVGCRDTLRAVDVAVPGAPSSAIDAEHREILARFAHVGATVRGVTLTWIGTQLMIAGRLEGVDIWLLLGAGLLPNAVWCLLRGAYRQVPGAPLDA